MNGLARPSWGVTINVPLLRVIAIVLPALFLVGIDILRHTLLSDPLHTFGGFVGAYAAIATAIVVFSVVIFGVVSRLQDGIAEQNRQLVAVNDIARIAGERLDLDVLLDKALVRILTVMQADAGLVCLLDKAHGEHSATCSRGFSQETVAEIQRAKTADDPIALQVVQTSKPVFVERLMDDPRVAAVAEKEGINSSVSVPLVSEGVVNGILVVASRTDRTFHGTDRAFLEGVGGQLGMAIRNSALYQQSERRNAELGAVLAVGKVVNSYLDFDEMLRPTLDTIIDATPIDAAELWLVDGNGLTLRAHRGSNENAFLERTAFRLGEGIPGIVAQTNEAILTHDLPHDPRFVREGVVPAGFTTFGAFPVRIQGRTIGVLAVAALSSDALSEDSKVSLLNGITETLAIAIENARLHEQVRDVAALEERERIAHEMHDGMGQLLGYINTQTLAVKKLVSDEKRVMAIQELTKMEEIARDLYGDVREGILGLKTSPDHERGLLSVLTEYVEHFKEMSGVLTSVEASPNGSDLQITSAAEIQLIRIVQEALSNVRRHAKAATAKVILESQKDVLHVEISDDGQGFDLDQLPSTGWPRFGLQTMQERAQAVGGVLTVETSLGHGTLVTITIPTQRKTTDGHQ